MTAGSRPGTNLPRDGGDDPSGTPGSPESLVFLCGADMNPSLIKARAGLERARFVAIARMDGRHAGQAGFPPDLAAGAIWGIALTIAPVAAPVAASPAPAARAVAATVSLVLRDGTSTEAALMTDPTTVGTVAAVLREAHYWELPVEYRHRLQALLSS